MSTVRTSEREIAALNSSPVLLFGKRPFTEFENV